MVSLRSTTLRACEAPGGFAGGKVSFSAFNVDGDRTGPIKDRDVIRHSAEQDNPGLRNAAVAIIDHKVIGTPQSQCTGREIELPLDRGQRRRQIAGFFLTKVVAHFDRGGSIWTSDRVALLSTSSAVTLPQPEEIRMRSCAIAGPINPSVMTKALKSSLNIRQQLLLSCSSFR